MVLAGKYPAISRAFLLITMMVVCFNRPAAAKQVPAYDCSSQTDLDTAECNALLALYTSTNNLVTPDSWINETGWLSAASPCNWFGVTCAAGHLSNLILKNNNLTGSLPAGIGSFADLVSLELNGNSLTGSLPPEIGALAKLITLNLSENAFSGKLPNSLGSLSALETLDLGNNSFNRKLPTTFANLKNLTLIDTSGNSLCIPDLTAVIIWYHDPNLTKIDILPNCDLPPTPTISLTPTETRVPITLTPTPIPLPTLTHTPTNTATSTATATILGPFQTLTLLAEWETLTATALWTRPPTDNFAATEVALRAQSSTNPSGGQAEVPAEQTSEALDGEIEDPLNKENSAFSPYWWGLLVLALGFISTGIILELKRR